MENNVWVCFRAAKTLDSHNSTEAGGGKCSDIFATRVLKRIFLNDIRMVFVKLCRGFATLDLPSIGLCEREKE